MSDVPRYCIDCAWYVAPSECWCPKLVRPSLVTGQDEPRMAATARAWDDLCGRHARHFVERVATSPVKTCDNRTLGEECLRVFTRALTPKPQPSR